MIPETGKRIIGCFTLAAFLVTFVLPEPLSAAVSLARTACDVHLLSDALAPVDASVPFGKVTGGYYHGSDHLIVLVQDLHCHPEVQKNIARLIRYFDEHYPVGSIFLEGAPQGKVNTRLLSTIPGKSARERILNRYLDNGYISGAEYYASITGSEKLFGLEQWDIYEQNYERVARILAGRAEMMRRFESLNARLEALRNNYLSRRVKRCEHFFNDRTVRGESASWYLKLRYLAGKAGIEIGDYPQLAAYIRLTELQREIDPRRCERELKDYTAFLRSALPCVEYERLVSAAREGDRKEYFRRLTRSAQLYTPNIGYHYPELSRFLEYLRCGDALQPFLLLHEEKSIRRDLLNAVSSCPLENEVLFLSEMTAHLSDYINLTIARSDLEFFSAHTDEYRALLTKYLGYADAKAVIGLLDSSDLRDFYETNLQRDRIFLNALLEALPRQQGADDRRSETGAEAVLQRMNAFRDIRIVVTGGFHAALSGMLHREGVSFLSVVPNVTEAFDDRVYRRTLAGDLRAEDYEEAAYAPPAMNVSMQGEMLDGLVLNIVKEAFARGKTADGVQREVTDWLAANGETTVVTVREDRERGIIVGIDGREHRIGGAGSRKGFLHSLAGAVRRESAVLTALLALPRGRASAPRSPAETLSPVYYPDNEKLKKEYSLTEAALDGVMPDIVLVMAEGGREKREAYRAALERHAGALGRVPVEFIDVQGGDGGRAFLDVFKVLGDGALSQRYPWLQGIPSDRLRAVVVNAGGLEPDRLTRPLPAEMKGKSITPFDLALLNGIRAQQELHAQNRGGIVITDPGALYLGPLHRTGDITLIGANVGYEQILEQKLPLLINNGILRKIYYRFNAGQIENALEKTALSKLYRLDNGKVRQMQTLTGNMIVSFDDYGKYLQFAEFIDKVRAHVNSAYRGQAPPDFDLYAHFIIPIVMLVNGENPAGFLVKLRDSFARGTDRDFYRGFYEEMFRLYRTLYPRYCGGNFLNASIAPDTVFTRLSDARSPQSPIEKEQTVALHRASIGRAADTVSPGDAAAPSTPAAANGNGQSPKQKAEELMNEWETLLRSPSTTGHDYDAMLDRAKKMIMLTPLSRASFGPNAKDSAKLYRRFSDLSLATVKETGAAADTALAREQFMAMARYGLEYLHALDFGVNIEILSGYFAPGTHWMERSRLMPLNRRVLGMTGGVNESRRRLHEQVGKVSGIGNYIAGRYHPLYDRDAVRDEIDRYSRSLVEKESWLEVGMYTSWQSRKGLQRFLSLFFSFSSVSMTVLTWSAASQAVYGGPLAFFFFAVGIPFLTGFGVSIFLHRFYIHRGMKNSFYEDRVRELQTYMSEAPRLRTALASAVLYRGGQGDASAEIREQQKENGKTVYDSAWERLNSWEDVLRRNKAASAPPDKQSLDTVRADALEFIRLLPLGKHTFEAACFEQTVLLFQRFLSLCEATEAVLDDLDETERNRLVPELSAFEEIHRYAVEYNRALDFAANLDILSAYRISRNNFWHWLERVYLMHLVRAVFGISTGTALSRLRLLARAEKITGIGNKLLPGLYAGHRLRSEVRAFADSRRSSTYFEIGMSEGWRERRMFSRFLPLILLFRPVAASIVTGTPLVPGSLLFSFATGVGLAIALHWGTIILNLYLGKEFRYNRKLRKFSSGNAGIAPFPPAPEREALLRKEAAELSGALDHGKAMPDLVVVMTGRGQQRQGDLQRFFEKELPGRFRDVPVALVSSTAEGDGVSFLDVFSFLNSPAPAERFPALAGRDLYSLRVLVVNAGDADAGSLTRQLPFVIDGKAVTPVELALLNGLRAVQSLARENRNGIVVMDPSAVYLGPLERAGDITFVGANVSYRQILEQGLTLLLRDFSSGKVRKLFHEYDDTRIQNMLARKAMTGMYRLGNRDVAQMQALTGNMIFSFDDPARFDRFARFMEETRRAVGTPYRGQAPPAFDRTLHLMIPLVMLFNREDPFSLYASLEPRFATPDDSFFYDDYFWALLRLYEDYYNEMGEGLSIGSSVAPDAVFTSLYGLPGREQTVLGEQLEVLERIGEKNDAASRFAAFGRPRPSRQSERPGSGNIVLFPSEPGTRAKIPSSLARYSAGTLERRARILEERGMRLTTYSVRLPWVREEDRRRRAREATAAALAEAVRLPLAQAVQPQRLTGSLARQAERSMLPADDGWLRDNAREFAGRTALFADDKPTDVTMAQMGAYTALGMNAVGVFLLDDADDRSALVGWRRTGNGWENFIVSVPVEGTFVSVRIWALPVNVTGKARAVQLYLEPLPEAEQGKAAPLVRNLDDNRRRIILGRGALAIAGERRPEFAAWLCSLGLPVARMDPVLLQMNGPAAAYAYPDAVQDGLQNDRLLETITYSYTGGQDENDAASARAMAEADAVSLLEEEGEDASMPEIRRAVVPVRKQRFMDEPVAAAKEFIQSVLLPATRAKTAFAGIPARRKPREDPVAPAVTLAPVVKLRVFTDLSRYARRMRHRVRAIRLEPIVMAVNVPGSGFGAVNGYCIEPTLIDWVKETGRLGLADKLSRLVADENASEQNRFYVALQCYQSMLGRRDLKENFDRFRSNHPHGDEIVKAARFMAASRILGRAPSGLQEINETANNPSYLEKWQLYTGVFVYMQFVADRQLKDALRDAHTAGIKVVFDFTVLKARESVDVLYHGTQYRDGGGNLLSPVIDGRLIREFALRNRYEVQTGVDPLVAELGYWFEEFEFDGVEIRGAGAYAAVRDADVSPDKLFCRLACGVRSRKADAIIVTEPFDDYFDGTAVSRTVGACTLFPVRSAADLSSERLKNEIRRGGQVWLDLIPSVDDTYGEFAALCRDAVESGVPAYISFPVDAVQGYGIDPVEFIRFLEGVISSLRPAREAAHFDRGYSCGKACPVPGVASPIAVPGSFVIRRNGSEVLQEVRAGGLHLLLVAWQCMHAAGKDGHEALAYHSGRGEFFAMVYDAMEQSGLSERTAPETWAYVRKLHRQAAAASDPGAKASINAQLFGFLQGIEEQLQYAGYLARGGRPVGKHEEVFRKLLVAADSFVTRDARGNVAVLAAHPRFSGSPVRDTFISMNGILLTPRRFEEARAVFSYFAGYQRGDGLLPDSILRDGKALYGSADTSLWFIEALNHYRERAEDDPEHDAFLRQMLPVVNRIVDSYIGQLQENHADRLIVAPPQGTWMSAVSRGGKPVEIQALFYNALAIAAELNAHAGDRERATDYRQLKEKVRYDILRRYFTGGSRYPYDVVDGDDAPDARVRPNAILLMSLSRTADLLPARLRRSVVNAVEDELLTPFGLRTLSPRDPAFVPHYDPARSSSRYQGAIWPGLMSYYVVAKAQAGIEEWSARRENAMGAVNNLVYSVNDRLTLPELFDADEPYAPGGALSRVSSVAALIEVVRLLYDTPPELNATLRGIIEELPDAAGFRGVLGAG